MTNYIENRKKSEENGNRSFGRATLLEKNGTRRIEKLNEERDADKMVHNRATRKIMGTFSVY